MRCHIGGILGSGAIVTMTDSSDDGNGARPKRDQIAENLKRVYDETLDEPLPEKLISLLERLKNLKKTERN
jgi:hypothetical protein